MKKKILVWEIIGAVFLIGFGSILHFTYAWSDYNPIVGLFSGVNESVWEHLKLGFWALIPFMIIEYYFLKDKVKNFFTAKALGILIHQVFIIIFFYVYTFFTGEEILIIDIISYVIGIIICQIISYQFLIKKVEIEKKYTYLSIGFLIVHAIILWIFTFYTPKLPIFKEDHSGRYGTEWEYHPEDEHEH